MEISRLGRLLEELYCWELGFEHWVGNLRNGLEQLGWQEA